MTKQFDLTQPHTVPQHLGFVELFVTGQNDPLPTIVSAYTHHSRTRLGLRLAGGCAHMSSDDKLGMLKFFGDGLAHFSGLVSSGGTREKSADNLLDPMITDVPALLVAQSPTKVISISSVPRTGNLRLVDDSRLLLSDDGHLLPNPGVHMIILVQSHEGTPLNWDGDLQMYFDLFGNLVRHGGWHFGMIVYNGGSVTRTEALTAMALGWPVTLIRGSGRMADTLIEEMQSGMLELPNCATLQPNQVAIVNNGDSYGLHRALVAQGLIAA